MEISRRRQFCSSIERLRRFSGVNGQGLEIRGPKGLVDRWCGGEARCKASPIVVLCRGRLSGLASWSEQSWKALAAWRPWVRRLKPDWTPKPEAGLAPAIARLIPAFHLTHPPHPPHARHHRPWLLSTLPSLALPARLAISFAGYKSGPESSFQSSHDIPVAPRLGRGDVSRTNQARDWPENCV